MSTFSKDKEEQVEEVEQVEELKEEVQVEELKEEVQVEEVKEEVQVEELKEEVQVEEHKEEVQVEEVKEEVKEVSFFPPDLFVPVKQPKVNRSISAPIVQNKPTQSRMQFNMQRPGRSMMGMRFR